MKNRIIAGLTLVSFLGLGLPVAAISPGSDLRGQIESSSGKVLHRTESGWSPVASGELEAGTLLRTSQNGEAVLHFPGDNRVRVSANSEVRVVAIEDGVTTLTLERGRVLGHVGKSLAVNTSRSNTLASEGEFVLETTAQGTKLNVLSGNAALASEVEVENIRLEVLPESVEQEALADLDTLGDVQSVGMVAAAAELSADGDGDDDDDGDDEDDDDNAVWAYTGAGVLVALGVLVATGGGDDDETVGTPSPNLP